MARVIKIGDSWNSAQLRFDSNKDLVDFMNLLDKLTSVDSDYLDNGEGENVLVWHEKGPINYTVATVEDIKSKGEFLIMKQDSEKAVALRLAEKETVD